MTLAFALNLTDVLFKTLAHLSKRPLPHQTQCTWSNSANQCPHSCKKKLVHLLFFLSKIKGQVTNNLWCSKCLLLSCLFRVMEEKVTPRAVLAAVYHSGITDNSLTSATTLDPPPCHLYGHILYIIYLTIYQAHTYNIAYTLYTYGNRTCQLSHLPQIWFVL